MSGIVGEAAYSTLPMNGEVISFTVTDTAGIYAIPAAFAGCPCSWTMEGADAVVVAGTSASMTAADRTAVCATATSATVTVNNASGVRLNDGVSSYYVMPAASKATHFSVDATAAGILTIAKTGATL